MQRAWLVCAWLSACVASESGNPSARCDVNGGCDDGLVCYRGFCVEDGEQKVDPITGDDAAALLERDAGRDAGDVLDALVPHEAAVVDAEVRDARVPPQDAAVEVDAAAPGDAATTKDAAVRDAALRDAAIRDAATPKPDAGRCIAVCKPPNQNSSQCKKCVQMLTGQDPEDLCGKPGGSGSAMDQMISATAMNDPFCISLCLGGASTAPGCVAPLNCNGPKCEGMP